MEYPSTERQFEIAVEGLFQELRELRELKERVTAVEQAIEALQP